MPLGGPSFGGGRFIYPKAALLFRLRRKLRDSNPFYFLFLNLHPAFIHPSIHFDKLEALHLSCLTSPCRPGSIIHLSCGLNSVCSRLGTTNKPVIPASISRLTSTLLGSISDRHRVFELTRPSCSLCCLLSLGQGSSALRSICSHTHTHKPPNPSSIDAWRRRSNLRRRLLQLLDCFLS